MQNNENMEGKVTWKCPHSIYSAGLDNGKGDIDFISTFMTITTADTTLHEKGDTNSD